METFGINIPNKTAEDKQPVNNKFPEEGAIEFGIPWSGQSVPSNV